MSEWLLTDERVAVALCVLDHRPVLVLDGVPLPATREALPEALRGTLPFAFLAVVDAGLGWGGQAPAAKPVAARRLLDRVVYELRHRGGWRCKAWGYALTPEGWYGVFSYDWGQR